MTAIPAPAAARPTPGARVSPWTLRLVAVGALGLFCAVQWAGIVRPSETGKLIALYLVAMVGAVVVAAAIEQPRRATRWGVIGGTVVVALLLMLLICGMDSWYLRPDRWDTLVVDVANGIGTLPALRMPYRGSNEWVRIVLLSGGGVLLLCSAVFALAPRPWTFGSAFTLSLMYVTAIVEHRPDHPYASGAVFALLLAALLWGDRLTGKEAPTAVALAVAAVLTSVVLAPRLDSPKPWVDYEAIAESLQGGKTTTFTWNHSYSPLDWPRDGLELARIRARGDMYYKTANLEDFDGREWVQDKDMPGAGEDTQYAYRHPSWTQTIHVDVKGLKSEQFLTAGTTAFVNHSSKRVGEATPGTFRVTDKPLRRGDGYDALVYYPRPTMIEMKSASTEYPYFALSKLALHVPAADGSKLEVHVSPWGSPVPSTAMGSYGYRMYDVDQAMAGSRYGREWALARELAGGSSDPYDFVQHVIARVQRDARYTETPPPPGRLEPLDAFLFRDRAGYCQHFAGATALLLRMGGVPARVVAGFAPGSRDGADHIVRDLDAHSWVEVYFPQIGWVTFDPTPGDSPARGQQTDTLAVKASTPSSRRPSAAPSDRTSDPTAGGSADVASSGGGAGSGWSAVAAVVLMLALAGWLASWRRGRRLAATGDPEVAELRLALRRSGRAVADDLTLARVEHMLAGSDGALGYVKALRIARYGPDADAAPTPRQRRALRRELAAGLGLRGRARALWALPPRFAELRDALRLRRRPS